MRMSVGKDSWLPRASNIACSVPTTRSDGMLMRPAKEPIGLRFNHF